MKKKFIPFLLVCFLFAFGFVIYGCDGNKNSFDVVAYTWNAKYGLVDTLDGTFEEGTALTVNAKPIITESTTTSSEFICWIHDSKVVSTEKSYTFTLNKKTSGIYYALFTCPEIEFVALDNFTFSNNLEANDEFMIKNLTVGVGDSLENISNVYNCTEDDLSDLSLSKTFDEIYAEDNFPYVFNKLENIYINITVTYMLGENEYTSVTEKIIPAVNIGDEVQELTFNLNKAVMSGNQVELVGSDTNTFTINFTSLENFDLKTESEE